MSWVAITLVAVVVIILVAVIVGLILIFTLGPTGDGSDVPMTMDTVTPTQEALFTPTRSQKIPFTVHQTFSSCTMPSTLKERIEGWRDMNPEYTHYYYDDEDCLNFLKEEYGGKVVKAYEMLTAGAAKADIWRYCMLYKKGGVYTDIASKPLIPLRQIISPEDDLVMVLDFVNHGDYTIQHLYNAFICVTPHHPLMKTAIDMAVERVLRKSKESIFTLTGPGLLAEAYQKYQTQIPRDQWRFNLRQENSCGKVRLYYHRHFFIYDEGGHDIISTKYRYYWRDRRILAGPHYSELANRMYK